jgi:hypothetical protein
MLHRPLGRGDAGHDFIVCRLGQHFLAYLVAGGRVEPLAADIAEPDPELLARGSAAKFTQSEARSAQRAAGADLSVTVLAEPSADLRFHLRREGAKIRLRQQPQHLNGQGNFVRCPAEIRTRVRPPDTARWNSLICNARALARDVLESGGVVATVKSCTLVGIDAELVDVECTIARGLPQYSVVGLAAPSVKEGATRIQSALKTVGYDLPLKKVTINLAPADLRKPGCGLDLPIALAVLIAEGALPAEALADLLVLGELGLDGTVRSVRGVLAAAMLTRAAGMRGIVVPDHGAAEAEVVDGVAVHAVRHLGEIIAVLRDRQPLGAPVLARTPVLCAAAVDMSEVRGQSLARAAVEVAVAGGHNLLLAGPPGTDKSMLSRRILTIIPEMTRDEALETTKVYSALGLAHGLIDTTGIVLLFFGLADE